MINTETEKSTKCYEYTVKKKSQFWKQADVIFELSLLKLFWGGLPMLVTTEWEILLEGRIFVRSRGRHH